MKKIILILFCFIVLISCGGGGGGGSSSGGGSTNTVNCEQDGIPKLSFSFSTTNVRVGQTVSESRSWCDSDCDIKVVKFTATYRGVTITDQLPFNVTCSGSGTVEYVWDVNSLGTYQMTFWLEDAKGNQSNKVSLTVTVSAMSPSGQLKTNNNNVSNGIIPKIIQSIR
jgi:hypothetical protein